MLPFAIGLTLAVGFGLLTGSIYGVESLFSEPWIMLVLWGLVDRPRADDVRNVPARRSEIRPV